MKKPETEKNEDDQYLSMLVLGILHVFFGIIILVGASSLLFSSSAEEIRSFTAFNSFIVGAHVFGALYLLVGGGLMLLKKVAYYLAYLTVVPWLLAFPIGTAVAIYSFVTLLGSSKLSRNSRW
jgi:hypothetical protein